jgi:hypothetical protein
MAAMIEIAAVEPLEGRAVRLTLSDGEVVVRDLGDLLHGPLFEPIADDDSLFRQVHVGYGTLVWPGAIDLAPETLIWDGPAPSDESNRRPAPYLRPRRPA